MIGRGIQRLRELWHYGPNKNNNHTTIRINNNEKTSICKKNTEKTEILFKSLKHDCKSKSNLAKIERPKKGTLSKRTLPK